MGTSQIYSKYKPQIIEIMKQSRLEMENELQAVDNLMLTNQANVLQAFRELKISEDCFCSSTGYGYNDYGREKLENLYAQVFGGERALVRPHFVSGTHTLTVGLFGLLRPGDEVLSVTGRPHESLHAVIGLAGENCWGSLREWGIGYKEIMYNSVDIPFENNLKNHITEKTKVIMIQRSRGYRIDRPALTLTIIEDVIKKIRSINRDVIIFVDNCYCEFVETKEPLHSGADIIVGSLIKNPGGGLAPIGGYIAGKNELVERIAHRLTAPGLGDELGAFHDLKRTFYQGFFMAPQLVGNALKCAIIASSIFKKMGYAVYPGPDEKRGDIVQAIALNSPLKLKNFCSAIQSYSPVDSFVTPQPATLAGYQMPIIMAAGTFNQGASSELSADAPFVDPYVVYLQGALTYEHGLLSILAAAEAVSEG